MITISIDLGERAYPVYLGAELLAKTGALTRELGVNGHAAIITDSTVGPLYAKRVVDSLKSAGYPVSTHTVLAGEKAKSFRSVETLCESLARAQLDRHSFIVALGGGVVGDLAGFVASIYYRGIPFLQIPTTIMAQVDSSIGGKTAINLSHGKNLVGRFHQPFAIIADIETLNTLGTLEHNEGFAEVIKYGVIWDSDLLETVMRSPLDLSEIVKRCIEIKAAIVKQDEYETRGTRELLNFGHTIGHAVEATAGYGQMLHGEAVSIGMMAAAWISKTKFGFPVDDLAKLQDCLNHFQLPLKIPHPFSSASILETVFTDKKFVAGKIRFVVASGLGKATVTEEVTKEDLAMAIEAVKEPHP
jgi:3-dehydroquinate synthase